MLRQHPIHPLFQTRQKLTQKQKEEQKRLILTGPQIQVKALEEEILVLRPKCKPQEGMHL
jgi:hypothetical protein